MRDPISSGPSTVETERLVHVDLGLQRHEGRHVHGDRCDDLDLVARPTVGRAAVPQEVPEGHVAQITRNRITRVVDLGLDLQEIVEQVHESAARFGVRGLLNPSQLVSRDRVRLGDFASPQLTDVFRSPEHAERGVPEPAALQDLAEETGGDRRTRIGHIGHGQLP